MRFCVLTPGILNDNFQQIKAFCGCMCNVMAALLRMCVHACVCHLRACARVRASVYVRVCVCVCVCVWCVCEWGFVVYNGTWARLAECDILIVNPHVHSRFFLYACNDCFCFYLCCSSSLNVCFRCEIDVVTNV